MDCKYNTIEQAIEALRQGKIILCTDDPDRENEGDLICAAQFATTENVNFMATYGKGLICTPMSAEIAKRLNLPQMVSENTDNHSTAFTVSIDHVNTTTGISAHERGFTCRACADPNTKPDAKRKITVTLEFQPDAERKHINIFASAKSTLVPLSPAATAIVITSDGNGEMVAAELTPQIPGQVSMEGQVQAPPKILKLVNNG